jgi:hypothetical protein
MLATLSRYAVGDNPNEGSSSMEPINMDRGTGELASDGAGSTALTEPSAAASDGAGSTELTAAGSLAPTVQSSGFFSAGFLGSSAFLFHALDSAFVFTALTILRAGQPSRPLHHHTHTLTRPHHLHIAPDTSNPGGSHFALIRPHPQPPALSTRAKLQTVEDTSLVYLIHLNTSPWLSVTVSDRANPSQSASKPHPRRHSITHARHDDWHHGSCVLGQGWASALRFGAEDRHTRTR